VPASGRQRCGSTLGRPTQGRRTVLDPDATLLIAHFAATGRGQDLEETRPALDRPRSFTYLRKPLGGAGTRDGGREPQ